MSQENPELHIQKIELPGEVIDPREMSLTADDLCFIKEGLERIDAAERKAARTMAGIILRNSD